MADKHDEVSLRGAFQGYFDGRFPAQKRVVTRVGPLPDGWVLAFSRATERAGAGYRVAYRVSVARRDVLSGEERAGTRNYDELRSDKAADLDGMARRLILALAERSARDRGRRGDEDNDERR